MRIASHHLDELSSHDSLLVHRCASEFEAAWQRSERPILDDYLSGDHPPRWARLVELVHTDLEHRLRAGEAVRVEDYLHRYPELAEDRQVLVDLLATEFELRCRMPHPSIAEYAHRFPDLEQELAAVLADETATVPLDCRAAWKETAAEDESNEGERCLGKYRLFEEVGSGSFGTVHRAFDTELRRIVALKLPRPSLVESPDHIGRFLREARSAAALNHPGIVTVHDAGQLGELCYLVSEFVAGQTLAQRLAAGPLPLRKAAQLAAAVAEALHHAHQNGIVHRDVKPSNILLDEAGCPRLTDFGLARSQAGEGTLSREGQLLGTLAYMAPEQASGETARVDARSDVYSVGVVLYEMLAGELPFRGNGRMMLRQVLEEEPRPPRQINDDVPRDLETICLKAMAKDPAGRYPTAAELAGDLGRFLRGEPVAARPIGLFGRCGRWCRRKPLAAALAASLLAAVAVGFTGVTWQWRQAEKHAAEADHQRDRAEGSARKAHQAINDFVELSRHPLLDRSDLSPVRQQVWRTGLKYYRDFLESEDSIETPSANVALRADTASAQTNLADLLRETGAATEAALAYEKACALWERLIEDEPQTASHRLALTGTLFFQARLQMEEKRSDKALASYRRVIQLLTDLEGLQTLPDLAWDRLLASYLYLGERLHVRGRVAEAAECYETACTKAEKGISERPAAVCFPRLAASYNSLMWLEFSRDRRDKAQEAYQRGIRALQPLADGVNLSTEQRLALAYHHHALGNLHRHAGQHEPALAAYRESQRVLAEVLRCDAAHFEARRLQARVYFHVCNVFYELHRTPEGSEACQQAYSLTGPLLRERPLHFSLRNLHGEVCFWRGKFEGEAGRRTEAIAAFREAAQMYDQLAQRSQAEPKWRNVQGTCLHCIGNRLAEMGRFAEAANHYRQAAALLEGACREMPDHHSWHANVAGTWNHLGEMEEKLGHLEQALAAYRRAIAHLRPVVQKYPHRSKEGSRLREFHDAAARLLRKLGREKEASDILAESSALRAIPAGNDDFSPPSMSGSDRITTEARR